MGFFDRFTGSGTIAQELIAAYGLKKATPYEPSIMQDWWEGSYGTMKLAVREQGRDLVVYLGDIVEVTDIYLVRVSTGEQVPPPESPQRIDRIVGQEGTALASQFVLAAYPEGNFDYPQLRLPELLHGLPRLSAPVHEVAIYENFRGLSLQARHPITRADFESDLRIASDIVRALCSWGQRTGPR